MNPGREICSEQGNKPQANLIETQPFFGLLSLAFLYAIFLKSATHGSRYKIFQRVIALVGWKKQLLQVSVLYNNLAATGAGETTKRNSLSMQHCVLQSVPGALGLLRSLKARELELVKFRRKRTSSQNVCSRFARLKPKALARKRDDTCDPRLFQKVAERKTSCETS